MRKIEVIKERINDREIKNFYLQMDSLQRYIKKLKEENKNLTVKDVKDRIYSDIYDVHILIKDKNGEKILESGKSDFFCLKTIKYIQQNPNKLLEVFEKIAQKKGQWEEEPNDFYEYNENIEDNIINILHYIMYYNQCNNGENGETMLQEQRKNVKAQFEIICKHILEETDLEEKIKSSYILRLSKMIAFLDKIGDLQVYNDLNNKRLDRMGLKDILGFEYKSDNSNECKMNYILELKNPKSLQKLDINQLVVLISFYLNRIEKTTESIEKVLFTLEKRGLLYKFFEGKDVKDKITDENVRFHIAQFKFLADMSDDILQKYIKKFRDKKTVWLEYDKNKITDLIEKRYINEYKEFSKRNEKTLPANLVKEVQELQAFVSSKNNLYFYKDKFMDIMMYNLLTDSKNINWGYVPEYYKFPNKKNSIQNKSRNILIKADIRGLNNPVSLHYDLEKIRNVIKNYRRDSKFPVYKGEEDFSIEGKDKSKLYMSNFILMPIHSSRVKKLKKFSTNVKEKSPYYKYIKHLVWISSPKSIPEHLKNNPDNEEKYVDLVTGNMESIHKSMHANERN